MFTEELVGRFSLLKTGSSVTLELCNSVKLRESDLAPGVKEPQTRYYKQLC